MWNGKRPGAQGGRSGCSAWATSEVGGWIDVYIDIHPHIWDVIVDRLNRNWIFLPRWLKTANKRFSPMSGDGKERWRSTGYWAVAVDTWYGHYHNHYHFNFPSQFQFPSCPASRPTTSFNCVLSGSGTQLNSLTNRIKPINMVNC